MKYKAHPNVILPTAGSRLMFSSHSATEKSLFSCYLDCESILSRVPGKGRRTHEHILALYTYFIVNDQRKIVAYGRGSLKDKPKNFNLAKELIDSILTKYEDLIQKSADIWNVKPELTAEDEIRHRAIRACEFCNSVFSEKNIKIRHHDWIKKVERNSTGEVVSGNYSKTLCNQCKLKISRKRFSLNTFTHNGSAYDYRLLLKGITKAVSNPFIVSKAGEKFILMNISRKGKKDDKKKLP